MVTLCSTNLSTEAHVYISESADHFGLSRQAATRCLTVVQVFGRVRIFRSFSDMEPPIMTLEMHCRNKRFCPPTVCLPTDCTYRANLLKRSSNCRGEVIGQGGGAAVLSPRLTRVELAFDYIRTRWWKVLKFHTVIQFESMFPTSKEEHSERYTCRGEPW